ncbi:hybrid sensor histidine kinase/response regulator [Actibacterium ureilyticum]|uniref:hybrid sensor histidine kinase/response regulator n=1 Tax=Actibacterium ureilyticum TaxID=1590614 RepID=UPI000BAB1D0B|nr:PAS-domain containing protein [Actibacterium ureilyticum]
MSQSAKDRARLTEAGLNLIQQALSIYDSDLKLAVANRRFREMFDLPPHLTAPGATFGDTIRFLVDRGEYGDVDDPEDFVQQKIDQARTFAPHYMERNRANGHTIAVEGSPLPQGGWVTVYTDITNIKRQERLLRTRSEELSDQVLAHAEELSQTNRALAATNTALEEAKRQLTEIEARTRLVTEMMPAHIAHVDPDQHYTYSNRRLPRVMPGRPADIVGLSMREALGEGVYDKLAAHTNRALDGEASVVEFTDDDSGRRIRTALTPDLGADAQVNGVYILSMDVTEEAQARAALGQVHRREVAAQMTNGLAHDFANLLTIILGLQSRLSRVVPEGEAAEMVAATSAAAHRGGVLLDRIATMTVGREWTPVATDLNRFLDELRTMVTPTLPENTRLVLDVAPMPSPLMLDPGGLRDSLLNLILNAKDAMGGAPGRITVMAQPIGDTWIEFMITDTGPGFSDEALERALNPFFTTKGGEGSGLGLSMVYDLIKLAGGRMSLHNTAIGARVLLRLPLRPAPPALSPQLVLLIDDNDEIRANVRDMLRDLGHAVVEAATAEEAEALAHLPEVSLILSDILLGGGRTGTQLLRGFAAAGITADLRLMTSLPATDPRRAQAGFPVIAKPFGPDRLTGFLAHQDTAA